MTLIDLNCDLGEGCGHDGDIMPLITSANIACGGHAGDLTSMRETVALAERHGVGIGAHPGYDDPEFFGRRELSIAPADLTRSLVRQISALCGQGHVRHVKPHGALYNLAARERTVAEVVVSAVATVDPSLMLFAPAASELFDAGNRGGLCVVGEAFADRRYLPDGRLVPRTSPRAVITDDAEMIEQVRRLCLEGVVCAEGGADVRLSVQTICLHGDGQHAAVFARKIRDILNQAGVTLQMVG